MVHVDQRMLSAVVNPLANEVPTSSDPIRPGPRVKATAFNSSGLTPARFKASETTGMIFC